MEDNAWSSNNYTSIQPMITPIHGSTCTHGIVEESGIPKRSICIMACMGGSCRALQVRLYLLIGGRQG